MARPDVLLVRFNKRVNSGNGGDWRV